MGELISSYHDLDKDEKIKFIVSTQFNKNEYMISVFDNGKIAKVDIQAYNMTTKKFKYNNTGLMDIKNIQGDKDVFLLSSEGKALICNTDKIGVKLNRNVLGNIGIKLNEGFKVVAAIIDVTKDDRLTIHTEKGKEIRVLLDDISPKDDTMWFDYVYGKCGNMGNFIYNTRSKNDLITNVEVD